MTPRRAIEFIRHHGVVLESARGLEPSLAAKVTGGPITGSWWGHPQGHDIYELTQKIHDSSAVLICTLARGRVTYIHRRLWPAFVRLAMQFPVGSLDRVDEVHTAAGRHRREVVPFPQWIPAAILAAGKAITESQARVQVAVWLQRYGVR